MVKRMFISLFLCCFCCVVNICSGQDVPTVKTKHLPKTYSVAKNLQSAISKAEPGDTILVADGIYKNRFVISKDLTLKGSSPDKVIFTANDKKGLGCIIIQNGAKVTIENISIKDDRNRNENKCSGINAKNCNITIKKCNISDTSHWGIKTNDSIVLISDCSISNTGQPGINANGGTVTIKDVVMDSCFVNGIQLNNITYDLKPKPDKLSYNISNCTISNTVDGIGVSGNATGLISGCKLLKNSRAGIFLVVSLQDNVIENNEIADNETGIHVYGMSENPKDAIIIRNNTLTNNSNGIVTRTDSKKILITSNFIEGFEDPNTVIASPVNTGGPSVIGEQNGIMAAGDVVMINNTITNILYAAIFCYNGKYVISDNECTNNYHGIKLLCSDVKISNNKLRNSKGCGLFIDYNVKGTIENNTVSNSTFFCGTGMNKAVDVQYKNNIKENVENEFWWNGRNSPYTIAFIIKDFEKLEKMASGLKCKEYAKVCEGSMLESYYVTIAKIAIVNKKSEELFFNTIAEWKNAKPDSVTPYILAAEGYKNIGWKARGSKFASEVPQEAWPIFKNNINNAISELKDGKKHLTDDPYYYALLASTYMASGYDFEPMLNEAFKINKYYLPLYSNHLFSLFPRWNGSYSRCRDFMDKAMELTKDKFKTAMYGKLAIEVLCCGKSEIEYFKLPYEKVKQGIEDLLEQYPNNMYYLNAFCYYACLYEDKAKAKELFDLIGNQMEQTFWSDQQEFYLKLCWANDKKPIGLIE